MHSPMHITQEPPSERHNKTRERERDGDRWEGWTGGGADGGRGMDGWTGGRGRNEAVHPSVHPSVGRSFDPQFVKTSENQ